MMMEGIGLERGGVGGSGALKSLRQELAEKKEPKRLALAVGKQAIEPSGRISEGKLELQLLKIFWIRNRNNFQKLFISDLEYSNALEAM